MTRTEISAAHIPLVAELQEFRDRYEDALAKIDDPEGEDMAEYDETRTEFGDSALDLILSLTEGPE